MLLIIIIIIVTNIFDEFWRDEMGKKKKIIIIIVSIILIVALVVSITVMAVHKKSNDIVLYDNVKIITQNDTDKIPTEVKENELVFDNNQNFSNGDVIVAGILSTSPNGFIRKVVSTDTENGKYIVKTSYACLTDVFKKAHIDRAFEISYESVTPTKNNLININSCINTLAVGNGSSKSNDSFIEFDFDKKLGNNISVNGTVKYKPYLILKFDIEDKQIDFNMYLKNTTNGKLLTELSSNNGVDNSINLLNEDLPPIEFTVGTVPVVITNSLEVSLNGSGDVQGSLSNEITLDHESETGFNYNSSNGVTEIKNNKYLGKGMEWSTESDVSSDIEIGINLCLTSKLYDVSGFDLTAGVFGCADAELKINPNNKFNDIKFMGKINLSIKPKLNGNIIVTEPVIDNLLFEQEIFAKELKPLWEKNWENNTAVIGNNSMISILVFEPGWPALSVPDEYKDMKWWDKSSKTELASFYETEAVKALKGNANTKWLLENDTFSDKKYTDGQDDVQGLNLSYYEVTYKNKSDINCSLICSPFTRWNGAFAKIYINEKYFTTVEFLSDIELMKEYKWDICSIKNYKLNIVNSITSLGEQKVEETTAPKVKPHMNGVLMVLNYGYCQKLSLSTIDDDLYLEEKPKDSKGYKIPNNTLVSTALDLYYKDKNYATVSVVDYDCSTIEKLNSLYINSDRTYKTKYFTVDDYTYSYMQSDKGEILPMVRAQLYIGGMCLYPVVDFNNDIKSEKELKRILKGLNWSYEWQLNNSN